MGLRGFLLSGVFFALGGCSVFHEDTVDPAQSSNTALTDLKGVSNDIYNELRQINASAPVPKVNAASIHGCSTRLVSIDLDGDIMLLIDDLAKAKFCNVRVVGKKPPQDIVLFLHYNVKPLWMVLEDAGTQLGNLGTISVGSGSVVFDFTAGKQK